MLYVPNLNVLWIK